MAIWHAIDELLADSPLLLLFTVAALGFLAGKLPLVGTRLGVAAVLFVGLGIGAIDRRYQLPPIVDLLGLVLFVYTVGLSSGPRFFASFRRGGWRANLLVLGALTIGAGITALGQVLLELRPAVAAGVFCGALTNTPALASVLQTIRDNESLVARPGLLNEPVVGYSLAYPIGVLGAIWSIAGLRRLWGVDYARDREAASGLVGSSGRLSNVTVRITRPEAIGLTIDALMHKHKLEVVFGRRKGVRGLSLVEGGSLLERDDLVSLIGTAEGLAKAVAILGEETTERIELDRSQIDFRRTLVSNRSVAGHTLADLNLPQQFGAVVTRVRRGDVDFLPKADTVLELGDRVRVVSSRENLEAVSRFLGDSDRDASEIDVLSLGLGIAIGLLLGRVALPLPGGSSLELGNAGGPLVAGLLLGTIHRTGPINWTLPHGASLTLRQLGVVLFLAGVGVRSGRTFAETIAGGHWFPTLLTGAMVTMATTILVLWVGHRLLRIPFGVMAGIVAGMLTQPAVIAYANEQSRNDLPNIGYASVYPLSFIAKIILAQTLFLTLS